ncbi:hypothetical protein V8E53_003204 [Lactarius tabidus]
MSYEADLTRALEHVGVKALVAQSKEVFMEVRNMIPKVCAPEKGKQTQVDDIPPITPVEMVKEVDHLHSLQECLKCAAHSKPGMTVFCWIETAEEGVKGGHCKMSHCKLTIWAKYITCGLATKTCPPNIKSLDYPPTKKVRTAKAAPEFHIEVNLAPTLGGGALALQGTCIVSDSQVLQLGLASASGCSCLEEAPEAQGPGELCSAPNPLPGCRDAPANAIRLCEKWKEECQTHSYDILTWMDTEHPQVDRHYMDSFSNFEMFGIDDTLNIMELEYMWDKIVIPLNLWETKVESYDSGIGSADVAGIFKWQKEVEPGYIEDIEDIEGIEEVKVEEVEEVVEEEGGGLSLDIKEISNFDYTAVNFWFMRNS